MVFAPRARLQSFETRLGGARHLGNAPFGPLCRAVIYYGYLSTMQFDPGPFYPEYVGGGESDFAAFAGEGITTTNVLWLDLDKATDYPGISDQQLTAGEASHG
jgi:hypothetical protein